MLSVLPSPLLVIINVSLVLINSACISILITVIALLKFALPFPIIRRVLSRVANQLMWLWATINGAILSLTNNIEWQVDGADKLSPKSWYLLICNHRSWADIVAICTVFRNKIPMPKFFLKQQLLYVPFIGLGCWALDMPFMRRYSHQYLVRHPDKRGADLTATREACKQFKHIPTTVVNFVEGTRFTSEKQQAKPHFQHLLPPKAGGIAYTLSAMGEQFSYILDVTILYPDNSQSPFLDILKGKMKRVIVETRMIEVGEEHQGNYFEDKAFKRRFQLWLMDVWHNKDQRIRGYLDGGN